MPRPGIEPGLEVPETSVMSFSLPGRTVRQRQALYQGIAGNKKARWIDGKRNRAPTSRDSNRHVGGDDPRNARQSRAAGPSVYLRAGRRAGAPVSRRIVRRGDRQSHALSSARHSTRSWRGSARAQAVRILLCGHDGSREHARDRRTCGALFFGSANDGVDCAIWPREWRGLHAPGFQRGEARTLSRLAGCNRSCAADGLHLFDARSSEACCENQARISTPRPWSHEASRRGGGRLPAAPEQSLR